MRIWKRGHYIMYVARPIICLNYCITFTVAKSTYIPSSKIWPTSVICKKQPKVNNHPIGENSPNLATLILCAPLLRVQHLSEFSAFGSAFDTGQLFWGLLSLEENGRKKCIFFSLFSARSRLEMAFVLMHGKGVIFVHLLSFFPPYLHS
jgi:hypothetical protein